MPSSLTIINAGTMPYREALDWQHQLVRARIAGQLDHDLLLLLQHPPVITLGRASERHHLLDLTDIEIIEVERGGDVTFHGPGQLVGYPIIDLRQHRTDLHWYLRTLEEILISGLDALEIAADRRAGYTGVWTPDGRRKIASIGVHVKRWVTSHGFALNVTTELSQFARIVPCGIRDVTMTSVSRELPGETRDESALMDSAAKAVAAAFETILGYSSRIPELVTG